MNTKQRAFLSSMATKLKPFTQIGKEGLKDTTFQHIDSALAANELVKVKILDKETFPVRETSAEIAEKTNSEVVRIIGGTIVLYRPAEEPVIELPK